MASMKPLSEESLESSRCGLSSSRTAGKVTCRLEPICWRLRDNSAWRSSRSAADTRPAASAWCWWRKVTSQVRHVEQRDHLSPPGDRERAYAQRRGFAPGARLSCACSVTGDLVVRVPEESQTRKQVVRKGAGIARRMTVDAAMRLYYVELPPAHLKDHRGDWERLAAALVETHDLEDLRIDLTALRELQLALDRGGRCVTLPFGTAGGRARQRFLDVVSISLDIGTTTMAAHLCNLHRRPVGGQHMNPRCLWRN